jgi:cytochrome c peroxidase
MTTTTIAMKTLAILGLGSAVACATVGTHGDSSPTPWELESPLRGLPTPPRGLNAHWETLPFRLTPPKVRLGRWLFFDKRLSADGTVSCATCHRPEHAFSEPTATSTGIGGQVGARKAPPILNIAWPMYTAFFWDGRADTLVEQAKGPIANPAEMGNTLDGAVSTIRALSGYRRAFEEAFGDSRVDADRVAEAIAAYEATRLSGDAPYDRYRGGEPDALSPLAQKGHDLFFGRAGCVTCHLGTTFSDGRFHNIGVGWQEVPQGHAASDAVRDPGRAAVTGREEDVGAFKTPTLRELGRRAPYMHDGSLLTLRDVVEYYRRHGRQNAWLSPEMQRVTVAEEDVDALVAFLQSLDGTGYEDGGPSLFPL